MEKQKQVGLSLEADILNAAKKTVGPKMFQRELRNFIHTSLNTPSVNQLESVREVKSEAKNIRFYAETLEIIDRMIKDLRDQGHTWINRSTFMRYVIREFSQHISTQSKDPARPTVHSNYDLDRSVVEALNNATSYSDFSHVVDDYLSNKYQAPEKFVPVNTFEVERKKIVLSEKAHSLLSSIASKHKVTKNAVMVHATSLLVEEITNQPYYDLLVSYKLKSAIKVSKDHFGVSVTAEKVQKYLED